MRGLAIATKRFSADPALNEEAKLGQKQPYAELSPTMVRTGLNPLIRWIASALSFCQRHEPIVTVVALSFIGLAVHYSWLTAKPLAAGDWNWISAPETRSWFPWRWLWDPSDGFGAKLFANSYYGPLLTLSGLLSRMGLEWGVIEKLIFFWPFAILSFTAPWAFARTLLRGSRWALVAVPIFALNTSIIIDGSGHLLLGVAESIGLFVLAAFLIAMSRRSASWAVLSGLLLGLEGIYEIRIVYLTVLVAAVYLTTLLLSQPAQGVERVVLSLLSLAAFVGIETYWLLPLLTYKSNPGLPFASSPWIAFSRLANGVTAVHPWWTGGTLAIFRTVALNPISFVIPLVAFIPLLVRRIRPEVVWLSLVALLAAFLLKQDNPPAGQLYGWLFTHIPGWSMFRDASKLYFLVALSYAVLIPIGLRLVFLRRRTSRTKLVHPKVVSVILMAAVLLVAILPIIPLASGEIGYATIATSPPPAFTGFQRQLELDRNYGPVLWFGGAVTQSNGSDHHFRVASPTHPLLELWGTSDTGDSLTNFCPTPDAAFCYLDDPLFPYLLSKLGVAYVVSPESADFGALPPGISRQWLQQKLSALLGSPSRFGTYSETIAVWTLPRDRSPVVSAPAITLVDGPLDITEDVLPALNALDLPVFYSQHGLPSLGGAGPVITVVPGLNGHCRVNAGGQFALLAATSTPLLSVSRGQEPSALPKILGLKDVPGWGLYGPITVPASQEVAFDSGVRVAACVAWSPVTYDVLRGVARAEGATHVTLTSEAVIATTSIRPALWLELKRAYDPGWNLTASSSHLVGDGLFNLYPVGSESSKSVFEFTTARWETLGALISVVWAILMGLLAFFLARRRKHEPYSPVTAAKGSRTGILSDCGHYAAIVGLTLLSMACLFYALAWWGLPSRMPAIFLWIPYADPYAAGEYYVALAFFALLIATTLRITELVVYRRSRR